MTIKRFTLLMIYVSFGSFLFAQAPGCPNITVTAPGSSGHQVTIPCNDCIDLTATVLHTGATNTYAVSSIPYAPPFPYTGGTAIPITSDDDWSGIINIPFNFCFFGTAYNRLIIGDNGVISFDVAAANGYCPYSFTSGIPYNYGSPMHIFGAFHDTYLPAGGNMAYSLEGTYPCRMFVFKFNNVAQYSCNSIKTTQMIILYETTNVVEVYIQSKPLCGTWNGGNAVVGIQNIAQTVAFAAPGRNSGQWVGTNEAWRFTPNGPANYTIQWYQGSTPMGNGTTINVCPTVPTTYTAIATYDNCDWTQVVVTDQMTVNPGNLSATVTPASSTICQGNSTTFTASATGNGPFTYNWSPPTGLNTTVGATVTANPSTTTTYTVTITDALGCSSEIDVPLTVNPNPNISLSASVNPICNGQTSELTASGGVTYAWSPSGSGSTQTVNPSSTTLYTVTGTDGNGCSSTASVNLEVNGGPVITITNSDPDICLGESSTLTANGGNTYLWNTSSTSPSFQVTPTATTSYQVTATDVNGCMGTASSTVTVHDNPIIDFTGIPLQGCVPLTVNFTSLVTGDPINNYSWNFGSAGSSTQQNPSKVFSQPGSYDVTLTATSLYGCTSTLTKSNYVTSYPQPSASFIATPPIAELGNSNIHFTDQSLGATSWFWDFGDGSSSSESNPQHYYDVPGSFGVNLWVYNEYGCKDSTWRWVQITYSVSFYVPNAFTPDDNGQNDLFGPAGVGIDEIDFYIYDRWGKMVFHSENIQDKWDGKVDGRIPQQNSVYTWKAEVKFVNGLVDYYTGQVLMIH